MCFCFFFFFNDTATTEIYTLSLHDALPISRRAVQHSQAPRGGGDRRGARPRADAARRPRRQGRRAGQEPPVRRPARSEEHTSELQSRQYLVCRLLLEKKNKKSNHVTKITPI